MWQERYYGFEPDEERQHAYYAIDLRRDTVWSFATWQERLEWCQSDQDCRQMVPLVDLFRIADVMGERLIWENRPEQPGCPTYEDAG